VSDYTIASGVDVPQLEIRVLPPHPAAGELPLSVGELIR
jgi:hypothetical protein